MYLFFSLCLKRKSILKAIELIFQEFVQQARWECCIQSRYHSLLYKYGFYARQNYTFETIYLGIGGRNIA